MRVLLTAFEPYDEWTENSSWLSLIELLKDRPSRIDLVTRRYPVDFQAVQKKLDQDLQLGFDAVVHLGQAPGAPVIKLEAIALNVAGRVEQAGSDMPHLIESAPLAFRSRMPLVQWADALNAAGIPAKISYHAGTFLCNATMYLSHYWYHARDEIIPVGFVHLPLATQQVAACKQSLASLPTETLARALHTLLDELDATLGSTADRFV